MATVYLDWTLGDDSRTYAQAQNIATPWKTPGKVNTSATTGDTAICAAGTYTWASITFGKNLTFQSATTNPSDVVFDASTSNIAWTITNYTITCKYITFYRGYCNTFFTNAFPSSASGIYFENCVFKDNKIVNSAGRALFLTYSSTAPNTATYSLKNCLIQNPYMDTAGSGTGIFYCYSNPIIILDKVTMHIKDTTYAPVCVVRTEAGSLNASSYIKNTIIYNNSGIACTYSSPYSGGTVTFTATYSDMYLITSNPTGTGVITTDPLFVDAANSNYNLRPTSPALDTGTTA